MERLSQSNCKILHSKIKLENIYRKIPTISPGPLFVERTFYGLISGEDLFARELIIGGNVAFQKGFSFQLKGTVGLLNSLIIAKDMLYFHINMHKNAQHVPF